MICSSKITTLIFGAAFIFVTSLLLVSSSAHASNPQINYQGKLTDTSGVAVADGTYNMWFYLYNTTGGATTTNIWEEQLTGSNQVQITNGLFSVMLGSSTPLTSVDFNQTLYLGVEIGGTGSPTWDGEMSPRKILGTVPAAFEAQQLDGIATSSFLRSDQADTIEATESGTLLTLIQNGAGAIFSAINSGAENVFSIFDSGIVAIGTSTDNGIATSTGLALYNKDVEVLAGDPVGVGNYNTAVSAQGVVVAGDYAYVADQAGGLLSLDISDPTLPVLLDTLDDGGTAYSVIVSGNYAYVADNDDGLEIIDISDPTDLVEVGQYDTSGNSRGVFVEGNHAYVADLANGLVIVDISDPANPFEVGNVFDTENAYKVVVEGNYAYVADGLDGLEIFDISDPTNPFEVGSVFDSGISYELRVSGKYAYVANLTNGLQIIDISDPTLPVEVSSLVSGSAAAGLYLSGNYAYLADQSDGLVVVDISSTTAPVEVGSVSDGASHVGVYISGGYAYSAASTGGLYTFSLPTLTTPTAEIGTLLSNNIESDFLRVTQALTADSLNINTNALIGGSLTITGTASSALQAANTNPALTITSGYVGIGTTTPFADLSLEGNFAITGGIYDNNSTLGTDGMVLQTTGSGVQWVATSTLGLDGGGGSGLFTDGGDISYLTSLTDVLAIGTTTDIATSTGLAVYNRDIEVLAGDPVKVGGVDAADAANDVVVVGGYAYVVSDSTDDDLEIFDISDPINPAKIGGAAAADSALSVVVHGDYAYVGSSATGDDLEIFDVSDPANPTKIGGVEASAAAFDIAVAGDYAYLVTSSVGDDLEIFDISDPTSPIKVGGSPADAGALDVKVIGRYAYVLSTFSTDDLEIFDVSDPTDPTVIGGVDLGTVIASGLDVVGNYVYTVTSTGGDFQITDISDPTAPVVVGTFDDGDVFNGVTVVGNYAYLAGIDSGQEVKILNISSSTNPVLVGSADTDTTNNAIAISGNYGYVVSEVGGDDLEILDLAGLITPTANIGSLLSNNIESDYLRVTQALIADSLNINTNALIGGSLTITGTASSALQAANTNPALTITSGYVGIGTTTPYADLAVDGNIALTGGIYDSTASLGTNGMVLQTTGSGVQWVATSTLGLDGGGGSGLFTDGGDITYLTSLTDVLSIGTSTDLATSTGLAVYNRDIEVLAGDPELVGNFNPGSGTLDQPYGFDIVGDFAYVVGYGTTDNLVITDVSDPSNPVFVGEWDPNDTGVINNPIDVDVVGNYAYVAGDFSHNLAIIDISDPTSPTTTGNWVDSGTFINPREVEVVGNYAYLVSRSTDNMVIIDISDPTGPVFVGEWDPSDTNVMDFATGISIVGNYAYISGLTSNNMAVVDISDPANPVTAGNWDPNDTSVMEGARDIEVFGKYAYIPGYNSDNVAIVDISDPKNPTTTANWVPGESVLGGPLGVAVVGNYIYANGFDSGSVAVADISSSTNPNLVGSWDPGTGVLNQPRSMHVDGVYAYVTGYASDNLAILSLPTLTTPTANIGNLVSNDIETSYLRVTQALVSDTLNVNTNAMVGGALTITGTASSSLIASNANVALTITSGYLQIGTSTTATSGIQVGYGGICVDNDGECTASTTGRISSVSTYSGNSDLAETYFSADTLEPGDIVQLEGELSISQANQEDGQTIIGVVSTKPGVLLGFDDVSTRAGEGQYPIALKGRIPVKISTENGPVKAGDELMLSSIPGTAMKATGTGAVVGIALEDFNEDRYYSDTFINQYTDDLSSAEDKEAIIEELESVPLDTATVTATTTDSRDDEAEVLVGQIVMFVDLSYRHLDDNTSQNLAVLMGTTSEEYQGDDEDETLFARLVTLARSFVDGVLSVFSLEAEKVEVAEELCISNTCIQASELQVLINSLESDVEVSVDDAQDNGDQVDLLIETILPTSTSTASSTASSTEATDIENDIATTTASSTPEINNTNATSTDSEFLDTDHTSTSSVPVVEDEGEVDDVIETDPSTEEESSAESEENPSFEEDEIEPEVPLVEEESMLAPTPPPEPEPESSVEAVNGDGGDI